MNQIPKTLSTSAIKRFIDAGRVIFCEGAPAGSAFVVEAGAVQIYRSIDGVETEVARLGPGEIFGEIALLDGGVRTASARALEQTLLFEIEQSMMRRHLEVADPVIGMVMRILVARVRDSVGAGRAAAGGAAPPGPTATALLEQMRAEREVTRAIRAEQFVAALQPIVSLADKSVVGFEALSRWNHPERGVVMPGEFIPLAESARLVDQIDWLCMKAACETLRRLRDRLGPAAAPWWVSVNLSGTHFANPATVTRIDLILAESGLPPSALKVEITETIVMADLDAAAAVATALRARGVGLSLDDFGVGYASLGYLHRMPLDAIKIDRSFVERVTESPKSEAIVRAMLSLGESFSLATVGEGIEQADQAAVLRALGCDYGQGWLFARPMLEADLLAWLWRR